ncbi:hypothetical protein C1H71_20600 (plasmid) [Iodobacter fluviatilis]|uniref:LysM domain-containing protein n=2 Tax=Iodobacter fluviatilis TaxID=537 RepID=A0A7G3GEW5_9NEIS|nr:hypothetical protein C1H71_20600 [Iodobacter fluviatilis]
MKSKEVLEIAYLPDSLNVEMGNEYRQSSTIGDASGGMCFTGSKNAEMSITLVIHKVHFQDVRSFNDTTNNSASGLLKKLYNHLYKVEGSSHKPRSLTISWGMPLSSSSNGAFKGVLLSMKVKEKHSSRKGVPTHVEIECKFGEAITKKERDKEAKLNSPDLTHYRQVVEGDRLDHKTWQIYGDSTLAPQVARLNGLNSPRQLHAGQVLEFSPFSKTLSGGAA